MINEKEIMENKISNENVFITFSNGERKSIVVRDLRDIWNETTVYTTRVRNIKIAWMFIEKLFSDERLANDLTFKDITKILDEKFNLKTRQYCAVD